ncbi:hypothetical protein ANOM_010680 [Aspergillus nomiae NRRL 13137]|uniref:BTB domain-containing protein n=1 Tax=Aspergillus nomiae NRRL (strain ATCC 15546 / NRRL 13137 / CBS 260.88 / M93) TaxID=1509407 RepID=A0A0L1INV4_ASPN3|nr:uncharacterized protein ANOM_010680 [Aspergillus nomiae NRRL 13137]KNG81169.1 hypothetical protein ANOM_010680 [Aspergillus nomiae NRRL 13137]
MPNILYQFDPDGDVTFIMERAPNSLPQNLGDLNASLLSKCYVSQSDPAKNSGLSLHIRASSKHLVLASPQFRATFQNGFQEGNELRSVGHIEMLICDWEPVPFLLLMAIFHGQTRLVPHSLCFNWLRDMAVLVDYYQCYEAVAMAAALWTREFEKKQSTIARENPMEWLCITWALRKNQAFEFVTKHIQLEHTEKIFANKLAIPAKVIDTLQTSRSTGICNVIDALYDLFHHLRYGPQLCSFECDLTRLAALVKGKQKFGIFSKTSQRPAAGYSFMKLRTACFGMDRDYSFHCCKLMPQVLKVLDKEYDSLNRGLTLGSFTPLRGKA